MKSILFFFALIALAFAQIENSEDNHGCILLEGQEKCCWVNNNGCCKPGIKQICTMAITTCCKTKVYDEATGTYKYEYNHHY